MLKFLFFILFFSLTACMYVKESEKKTYVYNSDFPLKKIHKNTLTWQEFKKRADKGELEGAYLFYPGKYDVSKSVHLKGSKKVHLESMDGALFNGNFNYSNFSVSSPAFILDRGNIVFKNFTFNYVDACISVNKNVIARNVKIEQLIAKNVNHCISINPKGNRIVENWTLKNINIVAYYKVAIRFSGKRTSNIYMKDIKINGRNSINDCYKGGIQLYQGAHNIRVENANIENNYGDCLGKYQQGDGIEIDHKGGLTRNIVLKNITVKNSGDANLDIKAENVTLSNVESIATMETKYAYKLWAYNNYYCKKCSAIGNFSAFINLNSAQLVFEKFTYLADKKKTALIKCKKYLENLHPLVRVFSGQEKLLQRETNLFNKKCVKSMDK